MEDQSNRPHRKAKEKKKKASGGENLFYIPHDSATYHTQLPTQKLLLSLRLADYKSKLHALTMYVPRISSMMETERTPGQGKRLHVPLVDRLPEEAPPIIVAVVGPPGVGMFPYVCEPKLTLHRLARPLSSNPWLSATRNIPSPLPPAP